MKIKKIIALLLSMIMALSCSMLSFANETNNSKYQEDIIFKQDIKEAQAYMNKHNIGLTLENQTQVYDIPLSSGHKATVTIELKKKNRFQPKRSVLTAKLGDWDIDYTFNIWHKGKIKLSGTFTVTHVPDMSSDTLDSPLFEVTGSSISVVPTQGSSVSDKGSDYETVYTHSEYLITGYATFDVANTLPVTWYVSMRMYDKTNSGSNRDKIYVDTNMSM